MEPLRDVLLTARERVEQLVPVPKVTGRTATRFNQSVGGQLELAGELPRDEILDSADSHAEVRSNSAATSGRNLTGGNLWDARQRLERSPSAEKESGRS
jgi:hypothetical protein